MAKNYQPQLVSRILSINCITFIHFHPYHYLHWQSCNRHLLVVWNVLEFIDLSGLWQANASRCWQLCYTPGGAFGKTGLRRPEWQLEFFWLWKSSHLGGGFKYFSIFPQSSRGKVVELWTFWWSSGFGEGRNSPLNCACTWNDCWIKTRC